MRLILTALATLAASPAFAAGDKPFFSLANTDFIVVLAFLAFVGLLVYLKVPGKVGGMLDSRAEGIRKDLNEARDLRDEAKALLASYERKQKEVQEQADRIVAAAKAEAEQAGATAKEDIVASVARRLTAAEEQITAARSAAVKEIRNEAVGVAVGAAQDIVASQMDAKGASSLIDDAIAEVGAKLH